MSHQLTEPQKKVVMAVIIVVLIGGFFWYRHWRTSFIMEPVMDENAEGVFKSHPDNAAPDTKGNSPRDLFQ